MSARAVNAGPQMTLLRESGAQHLRRALNCDRGQLSECCTAAVSTHFKTRGSLEGLLRYGRHSCHGLSALMVPCDPPLSCKGTVSWLKDPALSRQPQPSPKWWEVTALAGECPLGA
jgi:hypothetical protein